MCRKVFYSLLARCWSWLLYVGGSELQDGAVVDAQKLNRERPDASPVVTSCEESVFPLLRAYVALREILEIRISE